MNLVCKCGYTHITTKTLNKRRNSITGRISFICKHCGKMIHVPTVTPRVFRELISKTGTMGYNGNILLSE